MMYCDTQLQMQHQAVAYWNDDGKLQYKGVSPLKMEWQER
jgi:hypothetical protein